MSILKIKKKGFTLVEMLIVVIIVGLLMISLTKIVNGLVLYKYKTLNEYNTTMNSILVQNNIEKIDIKDFIIGATTYEVGNIGPVGGEFVNNPSHLLYFKNDKYAVNNSDFINSIKDIIYSLKIQTDLPFFAFLNSEKRIGLFGIEKKPNDNNKYNICLYYLDKNFYSKSNGKDKIQDIINTTNLKNLIEDFKNQKVYLLKDVIIDKDGSYKDEGDILNKLMKKEDINVRLYVGEQYNFFNNYSFTSPINASQYSSIVKMQSFGYYEQYFLTGLFKYQYLQQEYNLSFNKLFKGNKTYQ